MRHNKKIKHGIWIIIPILLTSCAAKPEPPTTPMPPSYEKDNAPDSKINISINNKKISGNHWKIFCYNGRSPYAAQDFWVGYNQISDYTENTKQEISREKLRLNIDYNNDPDDTQDPTKPKNIYFHYAPTKTEETDFTLHPAQQENNEGTYTYEVNPNGNINFHGNIPATTHTYNPETHTETGTHTEPIQLDVEFRCGE